MTAPHPDSPPPPRPDFIIIGAQKAGSTFLQESLAAHPAVFMPRGETPFFEDPEYDPADLSPLARAFPADPAPSRTLGIKRPNYLGLPEVPQRIARDLPGVRLLAVLRNPVYRAVSAYFHLMRSRLIPVAPIETGLPRVLDGAYDGRYPAARTIVSFGLYARHLARYDRYFPPERLKVVLYEQIKDDPAALLRDAFTFVGVDPAAEVDRPDRRPMPGMYSIARLRINTTLERPATGYFQGRTRMRRKRDPLSRALHAGTRALDTALLARLLPADRPDLSPALHRRLADTFADDVAALSQRLHRDLSGWLEADGSPDRRDPLHRG